VPAPDPMHPQTLDAIVVLGCRVTRGPLHGAAARRVRRAAEAWAGQGRPWVIASGGRRWSGLSEADAYAAALVARGVASGRILRELCSLSTSENAFYSAKLLRQLGVTRPGVVTCDFHIRRALGCFRAAGLDPVPVPVQSPDRSWPRWLTRTARERASAWIEGWMGVCDES
jgi:uncharacterized SAM-binding protein YcdF (DUF218 family)